MAYIVVKAPSVMLRHEWSMKDSLDGVLYENIADAVKQSYKLGAPGVAEIVDDGDIDNAEISNDSED